VPSSAIRDVNIHGANFGTNSTLPVSVEVVTSAEKGGLFLSTGSAAIPESVTMEIAGNEGVEVFQFVSNTNVSAIKFAVNRVADSTGVVAEIVSGNGGAGVSALRFQSAEYGSDSFVSVTKLPGSSGGSFLTTYKELGTAGSAAARDTGEDVLALINGNLALGDGTKVSLNSSALDVEMQLTEDFATRAVSKDFTITGGGANYQLGPVVETTQQISFGIQSVAASHLGDSVQGFLSSIASGGGNSLIAGNAREASKIIEQSITQVAELRGRLGAFERNTLQTNIRSLQIALENVTASESQIRDADFAKQTSELTRAQLLNNVGTTVLATANNNASNVLQLLQ
jgi:flagellin